MMIKKYHKHIINRRPEKGIFLMDIAFLAVLFFWPGSCYQFFLIKIPLSHGCSPIYQVYQVYQIFQDSQQLLFFHQLYEARA